MYKDNLVAALQKANQTGKCKGRIIVVEDSDNIKGFDGCTKLSCELCSFSHKLFNSEPSAEKPHSTYDCKNLNARMVMAALESGNSSPLFKLLVEILGLSCKFSKSTWGRHVKTNQDSIWECNWWSSIDKQRKSVWPDTWRWWVRIDTCQNRAWWYLG